MWVLISGKYFSLPRRPPTVLSPLPFVLLTIIVSHFLLTGSLSLGLNLKEENILTNSSSSDTTGRPQFSTRNASGGGRGGSVEVTKKLLHQGHAQLSHLDEDSREAVLVIGNTGAGKTTTTLLIVGDNSKLLSYETADGLYLIRDELSKISHEDATIVSKTITPDLYRDPLTHTYFFDCPGFKDTRSPSVEIANSVFMKRVADHTNRVKLLLIINYSSLKSGQDRTDLKVLIEHTLKFVSNVTKFRDAIALVATKVEPTSRTDDRIIRGIASFMTKARKVLPQIFTSSSPSSDEEGSREGEEGGVPLLTNARALIDALLVFENGTYPKISILRQPDDEGPLSEIDYIQGCRRRIRKMILEDTKFVSKKTDDFHTPLSPEATLHISDLVHDLNGNIVELVVGLTRETLQRFEDGIEKIKKLLQSLSTGGEPTEMGEEGIENYFGRLVQNLEILSQIENNHHFTTINNSPEENVHKKHKGDGGGGSQLVHQFGFKLKQIFSNLTHPSIPSNPFANPFKRDWLQNITTTGDILGFLEDASAMTLRTEPGAWLQPLNSLISTLEARVKDVKDGVDEEIHRIHQNVQNHVKNASDNFNQFCQSSLAKLLQIVRGWEEDDDDMDKFSETIDNSHLLWLNLQNYTESLHHFIRTNKTFSSVHGFLDSLHKILGQTQRHGLAAAGNHPLSSSWTTIVEEGRKLEYLEKISPTNKPDFLLWLQPLHESSVMGQKMVAQFNTFLHQKETETRQKISDPLTQLSTSIQTFYGQELTDFDRMLKQINLDSDSSLLTKKGSPPNGQFKRFRDVMMDLDRLSNLSLVTNFQKDEEGGVAQLVSQVNNKDNGLFSLKRFFIPASFHRINGSVALYNRLKDLSGLSPPPYHPSPPTHGHETRWLEPIIQGLAQVMTILNQKFVTSQQFVGRLKGVMETKRVLLVKVIGEEFRGKIDVKANSIFLLHGLPQVRTFFGRQSKEWTAIFEALCGPHFFLTPNVPSLNGTHHSNNKVSHMIKRIYRGAAVNFEMSLNTGQLDRVSHLEEHMDWLDGMILSSKYLSAKQGHEDGDVCPHLIRSMHTPLLQLDSWFLYLAQILEKFSQFEFQIQRHLYNVFDLRHWGSGSLPWSSFGGPPDTGICITDKNFDDFTTKLKTSFHIHLPLPLAFLSSKIPQNRKKVEDPKPTSFLTPSRRNELNAILDWTFGLSDQVICDVSARKVIVRATFLLVSEVNRLTANLGRLHFSCLSQDSSSSSSSSKGLAHLELHALDKIFIDEDIHSNGESLLLTMVARQWEIIGNRMINLDGKAGIQLTGSQRKAQNGVHVGDRGKDGKQGLAGGAGGTFLGIGHLIFRPKSFLTISSIGGQGGQGQEGGDGHEGTAGTDAQLPLNGTEYPTDPYWLVRSALNLDIFKLHFLEVKYAFYTRLHFFRIKSNDNQGGQGGDGGDGGPGGLGGVGGDIFLIELAQLQPPLVLDQSLSQVKLISKDGQVGLSGQGGKGGSEGKAGETIMAIREISINGIEWIEATVITTYYWTVIRTWSDLNIPLIEDIACACENKTSFGFNVEVCEPSLAIQYLQKDCGLKSHLQDLIQKDINTMLGRVQRRGMDGRSGVLQTDPALTNPESLVPEWHVELALRSVVEFRLFVRRQIHRCRLIFGPNFEKDLTTRIDNHSKVTTISSPTSFMDELLVLETHFQPDNIFPPSPPPPHQSPSTSTIMADPQFSSKMRASVLLLPYKSLEKRILTLARTTSLTPGSDDAQLMLYLITAVQSKIWRIGASTEPHLIVDIAAYMDLVLGEIQGFKDKGKVDAVNRAKTKYSGEIQEKIKEAKEIVESHVEEDIEKLYKKLDDQIHTLVQETVRLRDSVSTERQELGDVRAKLENLMVLQNFLGALKVGGQMLNFLGPKGSAIGSLAGGGGAIAETFIKKPTKPAVTLVPSAVKNSLNAFQNRMVRERRGVVDNFRQKVDLIRTQLSSSSSSPRLLNETLDKLNKIYDLVTIVNEGEILTPDDEKEPPSLSDSDLEILTYPDLKSLEEQLGSTLDSAEASIKEHLGDRTDVGAEETRSALDNLQNAQKTARVGIAVFRKYQNNRRELDEISAAIVQAGKKIEEIDQYKNKIYDDLIPMMSQMRSAMKSVGGSLNQLSLAGLDVMTARVQTNLREYKEILRKFTVGFEAGPEFLRLVDKLEHGMTTMTRVYGRIQNYVEHQNFAANIAQLNTPSWAPGTLILDTLSKRRTKESLARLDFLIQANMMAAMVEDVLSGFILWVFPFAHFFLDRLQFPQPLKFLEQTHPRPRHDGNTPLRFLTQNEAEAALLELVSRAVTTVSSLKSQLHLYKTTVRAKFDNGLMDEEFKQEPFFTWKNQTHGDLIAELLSGKEIFLRANLPPPHQEVMTTVSHGNSNGSSGTSLHGGSYEKEAVKFNFVDIWFNATTTPGVEGRSVIDQDHVDHKLIQELADLRGLEDFDISLVHMGSSSYRFEHKVYRMTTTPIHFLFSVARTRDGEPLRKSMTYDKMKKGNLVLSPYSMWAIKLIPRKVGIHFNILAPYKNRIDLSLVGEGSCVRGGEDAGAGVDLRIHDYYAASEEEEEEIIFLKE